MSRKLLLPASTIYAGFAKSGGMSAVKSLYSTSPCTDHIEIGLLQRSAGRLTTDLHNRTTSASTKRCGTSDLRVGSKGARHSMSSPTALVACPLAHPVQTVLYYAFSFQRKLPGVVIRHRSDSECQ